MKILKSVYKLLLREHSVGFIRFCYAALILCALSRTFALCWLVFLDFILALTIQANTQGWNKEEQL